MRTERVITARTAVTVFYCGACGYSWEEPDRPDPARTARLHAGHDRLAAEIEPLTPRVATLEQERRPRDALGKRP